MRLHEFIRNNREEILMEWESFARTCAPASSTMDVVALRDHATQLLTGIAADLEAYDPQDEPVQDSQQHDTVGADSASTAAEEHGAERADSGFTVEQAVAEYRALRASVLGLWTQDSDALNPTEIADMIRFNESIDQSLAESIAEFTDNVENAKEMFLAILGHDLRNPLGAIYTSATFLSETGEMDRTLTMQIAEAAQRATLMVGDLLDFTRGRLGGGIPVDRAEVDLGVIVQEVAREVMAAHPGADVRVEKEGEEVGRWDAPRIRQALTNLVVNAVEHGTPDTAVRARIDGDETEVTIRVHNRGDPIPPSLLDSIFDPMRRGEESAETARYHPTGHLGLGLHIAERIVHAHGGRIEVESSQARGTTFTVHMPRGVVEGSAVPTRNGGIDGERDE